MCVCVGFCVFIKLNSIIINTSPLHNCDSNRFFLLLLPLCSVCVCRVPLKIAVLCDSLIRRQLRARAMDEVMIFNAFNDISILINLICSINLFNNLLLIHSFFLHFVVFYNNNRNRLCVCVSFVYMISKYRAFFFVLFCIFIQVIVLSVV